MCGLAGEIRFDGGYADVSALRSRHQLPRLPRTGRGGRVGPGTGGPRPPSPVDHRPVRRRIAADGRQPPGPDRGVQRLHLQLPGSAGRARGSRLHVLLHLRHRGDRQGVRAVGHRLRPPLLRDVRLRRRRARHRPAGPRPGPARHQAALPGPDPTTAAVRLHAPRPAGRWRYRHLDRPHRAGALHDVPQRGAAAADDPQRHPQAAAGHRPGRRAGRPAHRPRLLAAGVQPRP